MVGELAGDRRRTWPRFEIRSRYGRRRSGRRAVEKVLAHHADNFVLFDVPPLRSPSGSTRTEGRGWTRFFPWFGDAGTFEVSGLQITAGQDVAYCHGLIRCSGTDANGRRTEELAVRLTVGLAKIDGAWTVVHEHHSQPSG
jgi:ketosteroid isomerase-like protein